MANVLKLDVCSERFYILISNISKQEMVIQLDKILCKIISEFSYYMTILSSLSGIAISIYLLRILVRNHYIFLGKLERYSNSDAKFYKFCC